MSFRPTAIPLVTTDPFFSIWSFSDALNGDTTRHWTGHSNSIYGALSVDGAFYRFMGTTDFHGDYLVELPALEQTSVTVNATTTTYTFSHAACDLRVSFYTPLLMDRLEVLSRPVSYVHYEILPKQEGHTFKVYFDASSELCGDLCGQTYRAGDEGGHVWIGNEEQKPLKRAGDDVRIEWGYLHLVHENARVGTYCARHSLSVSYRWWWSKEEDVSKPIPFGHYPVLYTTSEKLSDTFVLAYDDVHSVEYFHKPMDAYYKRFYASFDEMLRVAVEEAETLRVACEKFDAELNERAGKISEDYARICSLAYRQAIAAHKTVDVDGELMFFSKENFSNGCMATLDVTYPSIPLFLCYNPELVRGMMRPLLAYAKSELWPYTYAPHDCGRYPLCNGQVYSTRDGVLVEGWQMPVEECGNALLVLAAACAADGDRSLIDSNKELLKQWADYLVEYGYDPGNQLCTDDFAGHLAHNANLSIKAIVALGAYAKLFDAPEYLAIAKDMATRWTKEAKKQNGKGWRLTFDMEDSWSLKYNIVWDKLLNLGLFDGRVFAEEVEVYTEKMNRYGVPLDSRSDYTKTDWLAWTTVMTDDEAYTKSVYRAIADMIGNAPERVPLTDWYFTSTAVQRGFQARSVVGGLFINLLK